MITGTVWGITLILLGFLLSLGATQVLMLTVFPRLVERTAENAARTGRRLVWNLVRGFAAALFVIVLFAAFANGGPGVKALTVLPLFGCAVLLGAGLAGVSMAVGQRLPSPADEGRPWRALVRGVITTELAFLVPFVGWLFFLPLAVVMGLGAMTRALLKREREPEAAAPTHAEPEEEPQPDEASELQGIGA
jgi:hypothetical protein